jgi:hypothetical protein
MVGPVFCGSVSSTGEQIIYFHIFIILQSFFTSVYSCKYLVKCVRYPEVYLLSCYVKVLSFKFSKEVLHFPPVVRDLKLVINLYSVVGNVNFTEQILPVL